MSNVALVVQHGGAARRLEVRRDASAAHVAEAALSALSLSPAAHHLAGPSGPIRDDVDLRAAFAAAEAAGATHVALSVGAGAAPAAPHGSAAPAPAVSAPAPARTSYQPDSPAAAPSPAPAASSPQRRVSPAHLSAEEQRAARTSPSLQRLADGAVPPSVLSSPPAASPSKRPKFCAECGVKAGAGKFCSECGHRLAPTAASPAASPARVSVSPSAARPAAAADLCPKCSRPLPQLSGVVVNGARWHKECFVCRYCAGQLANKPFTMDGEHCVCNGCFLERMAERCGACSKPIDGAFLKVQGQAMHHDCFTCCRCARPIKGPYVLLGDRFCCSDCG